MNNNLPPITGMLAGLVDADMARLAVHNDTAFRKDFNGKSTGDFGYSPGHRKMARWLADRYARCRWLARAYKRAATRMLDSKHPDKKNLAGAMLGECGALRHESLKMRREWRVYNLCVLVKFRKTAD
jgi:hypothetical protein